MPHDFGADAIEKGGISQKSFCLKEFPAEKKRCRQTAAACKKFFWKQKYSLVHFFENVTVLVTVGCYTANMKTVTVNFGASDYRGVRSHLYKGTEMANRPEGRDAKLRGLTVETLSQPGRQIPFFHTEKEK